MTQVIHTQTRGSFNSSLHFASLGLAFLLLLGIPLLSSSTRHRLRLHSKGQAGRMSRFESGDCSAYGCWLAICDGTSQQPYILACHYCLFHCGPLFEPSLTAKPCTYSTTNKIFLISVDKLLVSLPLVFYSTRLCLFREMRGLLLTTFLVVAACALIPRRNFRFVPARAGHVLYFRAPRAGNGETWALLVAGSNGWYNYRHQADTAHAYQVLKNHGIPADRIM